MLPQLRAMYNGDRARKSSLVDFGFRLPSALDNRPLKFEEFNEVTNDLLFVSATPGKVRARKFTRCNGRAGYQTDWITRPDNRG